MGSIPIDESADNRVKSIFCFTIAPHMQRKGITTQLLDRVCQDAALDGFHFVEVYPNKSISSESENHGGFTEMYEKKGFAIHAELESIYVMRKKLHKRESQALCLTP